VGAWTEVLSDAKFWESFADTVIVTIIASALVLVLAWLLALYMRFMGGKFARFVVGLSVIPMFIPVVIASYAMLSFYGTDGFLRTVLNAIGWHNAPAFGYTVVGIVLGSIWVNLPFAVLMISSGLASVPETLLESAKDVGASSWMRFRSILLPMTKVPTIIAATFTAITILGSFTLPFIIGPSAPNLLGVLMDNTYTAYNQPQQAEVMAIVVFVLASFASVPYLWANFKSARQAGAFK
jgi:ABC-type spermidine/putrescine transport system permease subunit I